MGIKWEPHRVQSCIGQAEHAAKFRLGQGVSWLKQCAYRLEDKRYAVYDPWSDYDTYQAYTQIELTAYPILRETPFGFRVALFGAKTRFVRLDAVKQFCHPDIDEAVASFVARKTAYIRFMQGRIALQEAAIKMAVPRLSNWEKKYDRRS